MQPMHSKFDWETATIMPYRIWYISTRERERDTKPYLQTTNLDEFEE
jgi:hypothetical protein